MLNKFKYFQFKNTIFEILKINVELNEKSQKDDNSLFKILKNNTAP